MRRVKNGSSTGEAGFSIPELLVAMAVTLILMTMAGRLLMHSFNVRAREDRRADAIADVQRALNIMAREIANSGYSLPSDLTYTPPGGSATRVPANGLLPGFSNGSSVAFVSNLNANGGANNHVNEADESIMFTFWSDPPPAPPRSFLVRKDLFSGNVMVLANRIDSFTVTYYNRDPVTRAITAAAAGSAPNDNTVALRLTVTVTLPAIGKRGTNGYQPPFQTVLETNVALRNANLDQY